jgi:undecaprenyl-diphosphatase
MNIFESLFLGLIQGFTEFLPVSSSGHLTLFGKIFHQNAALMMSFTTLLHMGTLISVLIIMRLDILDILKDIFGKKTWLLLVATIPAVLAALLLGDLIDSLFGGNTLGYEFLFTGVVLLATLVVKPGKNLQKDVGYPEAIAAGIGQAIAIAPAVSRSGTSLAALLLAGVNRQKAIRFTFLMSIPAILGGFAKDMLDMAKGQGVSLADLGYLNLAVGIVAAAVAGWLAMDFMIKKLTKKGILICAIYVIVLGTLILLDQNFLHLVF